MRTVGSSTLRGGQTVFHGLRMWGQLLRAGIFVAAAAVVAVPGWHIWHHTSGYDWYAAGIVTVAEAKVAFGYRETAMQEVRMRDGRTRVLAVTEIAASPEALAIRKRLRGEVFASAILGAKASVVVIALFLALFWYRGHQLNRARRLRGAELATAAELARRIRPVGARLRRFSRAPPPAPYRIAGVPYPVRTETQHTIVSGTTGSGKTVLISDLVAQVRAKGERCVVYDKMGSYTRSFFDPARDVLLNPLDARAPRWSPFFEARNPRDFDTMAAALVPQQKDTVDPFWVTAARQLFSNGAGVLWKKGITENSVLVDHLLKTELTALAQAMEGTVAQSIVDPENPKTALSVRAMLTAHLGALELLPDTGKPFSIREWISQEDREGFLFLTSRGDQHASLRGLISTWLEIAVNALLSLEQDDGRRVWVILDELPTLHQVPSLQPGLAESRQFGGCFVLGVQVISALRDLYGRNGAETISGLCGTRVVLAAPDRDTAQWSADSLGRAEVEEVAEGFSYGANTIRDGVSLTPKRELRALALASEIMRLENLSGYLRFPGPLPVATIELDYVNRGQAAERFVPREGGPVQGALELPPPDTPAAAADEPTDQQAVPLPEDAPSSPDAPPNRRRPRRAVARRRMRRRREAAPRRLDLTWWPRSAPSPRRRRGRATTSATATTRRTIPNTATPAPGPAAAPPSSVSRARSTRTPSGRSSKAMCPTAPGSGSGASGKTARSSTGRAATSPSRPRNPSPSRRSSAATGASSTPTTAPSRAPSPGSRGTSPRPG